MKLSNSLDQHSVKRIGLIFAIIFIVLEIVANITGTIEEIDVHLVNLYILLALSMMVFSKEKTDDERTQIIRYFTMKTSFRLLIYGLATIYLFEFNIEIIYIAILSLIMYLIIFYLTDYFNPSFIFKEKTKDKKWDIKIIVGIMIFMGIAFSFDILATIITS